MFTRRKRSTITEQMYYKGNAKLIHDYDLKRRLDRIAREREKLEYFYEDVHQVEMTTAILRQRRIFGISKELSSLNPAIKEDKKRRFFNLSDIYLFFHKNNIIKDLFHLVRL